MFRAKLVFLIGAILLAAGAMLVWLRPSKSPSPGTSQLMAKPQDLPSPTPIEKKVTEEDVNEPVRKLSAEDEQKLAVVDEVLASRNDSDPRLDREIRDLSPALKARLRERYHEIAPEDRAGRGMIIFILGRELKSIEDVEFLSEVLQEPPCRSLEDCTREPPAGAVDEHAASIGNVTLVYPQLVAIKSLERALRDSNLKSSVLETLESAERYGHPNVARAARDAIDRATEGGSL